MSNLRTRRENELLGGSDYDDLDSFYPIPPKEKAVEVPQVAETGPGDVHPPLDQEKRNTSSSVEPWWAQQDLDLHWIEAQQEQMGQDDETDSRDPQEFK